MPCKVDLPEDQAKRRPWRDPYRSEGHAQEDGSDQQAHQHRNGQTLPDRPQGPLSAGLSCPFDLDPGHENAPGGSNRARAIRPPTTPGPGRLTSSETTRHTPRSMTEPQSASPG